MNDTNELPSQFRSELAVLRTDVEYLKQNAQAQFTTLGAIDGKLDMMRDTYMTQAEFGRWKKEDYQPHKETTAAQFRTQGERISRWLGIVIGVVLTGAVTLSIYLIVAAVGSGVKP